MFFLIKSAIIIYLLLIFTTFLIDKLVDKYIAIQPGMSEAQIMKTAVHETAHAVLHDRDQMEAEGIVKDQLTREVEALYSAFQNVNHFKEC